MHVSRYTNTTEDTVAVALKGGTDLNCGNFYQINGQVWNYTNKISSTGAVVMVWLTIQQSKDAYDKKKITDDDLNLAVSRLFGYRLVRSFLSCM